MSAADPAHPSFPDLPQAALACILEHVPLQQRLSSCALVCRSWAAAAAGLPAHVDVGARSDQHCSQLSAWLEARGQQVASVAALAYGTRPVFRLPCHKLSRLQHLDLSGLRCHLMLQRQGGAVSRSCSGAAADSRSSNACCGAAGAANGSVLLPQLRALRLAFAGLIRHEVLQLPALSRLTQLHLCGLVIVDATEQPITGQQQAAAITYLLQHLTGLSDLKVKWCGALTPAQLMGPISAMQRLQRVELSMDGTFPGAALAALPVSLTALLVVGSSWPTIPAAAQLSRLTNLQHLSLDLVQLPLTFLAGLTGLQDLRLLYPYACQQAPARAPALLAAVAHCSQLRHLQLQECGLGMVQPPLPLQQQQQQRQQQQRQEGDGWQRFSALTASTQLTALRLSQAAGPVLPGRAALDQMLPAGRAMPHLAVLDLRTNAPQGARGCVGRGQIARIAASCPNLRQLVLKNVTPPDLTSSCLTQLPPGVTHVQGLSWQRPAV